MQGMNLMLCALLLSFTFFESLWCFRPLPVKAPPTEPPAGLRVDSRSLALNGIWMSLVQLLFVDFVSCTIAFSGAQVPSLKTKATEAYSNESVQTCFWNFLKFLNVFLAYLHHSCRLHCQGRHKGQTACFICMHCKLM